MMPYTAEDRLFLEGPEGAAEQRLRQEKDPFLCYILSCVLYYLWAALCGLFCIAQQFTWETLVQVQCGASCRFSNLGTKASSEVASHYRTSVKNAGSVLSMDLCFRNRLGAVTGKQVPRPARQISIWSHDALMRRLAFQSSPFCFSSLLHSDSAASADSCRIVARFEERYQLRLYPRYQSSTVQTRWRLSTHCDLDKCNLTRIFR